MFKTLNLYRLPAEWRPLLATMETDAGRMPFTPTSSTQQISVGWVPPRGEANGALVESVAGQRIMKLMIETRGVPGAAVRKKAQEEADHIEATTGRKPGKKETKALREDALLALLPHAFPRQSSVLVWIDLDNGLLATDATSQGKTDEVVTALVRTFDDLAMRQVHTNVSPQAAMASWLSAADPADAWPEAFDVGRECELRSADEQKAVVKFKNHHLLTDEVRQHITEGKLPTWTAMTWEGRVSFVLSETWQLRKITFLDGVLDDHLFDEGGFDADVTIATGELQKLIPALIDALGGEMAPQAQEGGSE